MNETARRPQWVLASANPAKAAEMAALLDGVVDVAPRPADIPDVIEDAPDLEGNARLKAHAVRAATGSIAVADDTGLFVDALDGAPGVRSARFAGEPADDAANVALLLSRLEGFPTAARTARFVTVVVVARPDSSETVVEGSVDGVIATDGRGDGGFGYDPVFIPLEGDGRTFAEMDAAEKNALSHRGRAMRRLRDLTS
jgi:XTP/dITP diphosphohydrolase